jgi:hypothetical protein
MLINREPDAAATRLPDRRAMHQWLVGAELGTQLWSSPVLDAWHCAIVS